MALASIGLVLKTILGFYLLLILGMIFYLDFEDLGFDLGFYFDKDTGFNFFVTLI